MRWRVGLVNGGGMAYRSGIGQGSRHTPPGPVPAQETLVCAASNTVPNYDELGFSPGIISRCRTSNEEPKSRRGLQEAVRTSSTPVSNLSDGWVRKDCCPSGEGAMKQKRAVGSLKSAIGVVVTGGEGPTFKSAESGLVQ